MSSVLRISGPGVNTAITKISVKPYRNVEGTIHFEVSEADFEDFTAQINDSISFLQRHMADVKLIMSEPGTSGVLDFAIEWRDVAVQIDNFPVELVREAGNLGLALEISHYHIVENGP